jgi:hypothetical protein
MTSPIVVVEPSHHKMWAAAASYTCGPCDWIHPHIHSSILRSELQSLSLLDIDSQDEIGEMYLSLTMVLPTKEEEVVNDHNNTVKYTKIAEHCCFSGSIVPYSPNPPPTLQDGSVYTLNSACSKITSWQACQTTDIITNCYTTSNWLYGKHSFLEKKGRLKFIIILVVCHSPAISLGYLATRYPQNILWKIGKCVCL